MFTGHDEDKGWEGSILAARFFFPSPIMSKFSLGFIYIMTRVMTLIEKNLLFVTRRLLFF